MGECFAWQQKDSLDTRPSITRSKNCQFFEIALTTMDVETLVANYLFVSIIVGFLWALWNLWFDKERELDPHHEPCEYLILATMLGPVAFPAMVAYVLLQLIEKVM